MGAGGTVKTPFNEMDRRAFTLIEITLGVALAAVVGLAVFSTFLSGVRLWQRHQEGTCVHQTALFVERMQRDLENGSPYAAWELRGNATQCEFPAFVRFVAGPGQETLGPGRILYAWDPASAEIRRAVASVSDDFQGAAVEGRPVLSGVESFTLSYYFLNPQSDEYAWSEQWPPESLVLKEGVWPLAVRCEVSVRDDKKTYEAVKIFSLPLGG